MFARAERRARRARGEAARASPASAVTRFLAKLGLSASTLRRWEEAGVVAFERRAGRRLLTDEALERVRLVARMRREGFSVREIAWCSPAVPPSLEHLRAALDARLTHR
ncbi:MAG: MerR family transcriptional regulator [Pseudomonadota bacterium]